MFFPSQATKLIPRITPTKSIIWSRNGHLRNVEPGDGIFIRGGRFDGQRRAQTVVLINAAFSVLFGFIVTILALIFSLIIEAEVPIRIFRDTPPGSYAFAIAVSRNDREDERTRRTTLTAEPAY